MKETKGRAVQGPLEKSQVRLGMIGSVGHGKSTLNAAIGKVMTEPNAATQPGCLKRYVAAVGPFPGWHVGVLAESGAKAKELLELQHGKANVFHIHRDEDEELPR